MNTDYTDYFKEHLSHYSYYRYMAKTEPEAYTPLYNMVKKWLYFLPKRERKVLFYHYCLHKTPDETAAKTNMQRTAIYYYESSAVNRLLTEFYKK